jgi:hypothetical protein
MEPPLIINASQIDDLIEAFRGALLDCRAIMAL